LDAADVPVIVRNEFVGAGLIDQAFAITTFLNTNHYTSPDPDSTRMCGAFMPDPTGTLPPTIRAVQFSGSISPTFFFIFSFLLRPQSSGSIQIQNSDPLRGPLPDPGYLTNPEDVTIYKGIFTDYIQNFAISLTTQDPSFVLVSPTLATIQNDAALTTFLHSNVQLAYHWTSSIRMNKSKDQGAVDAAGNVYGARNLVVADDTILPFSNGGNTQSTAYLVGWKISEDLIKSIKHDKKHHRNCCD